MKAEVDGLQFLQNSLKRTMRNDVSFRQGQKKQTYNLLMHKITFVQHYSVKVKLFMCAAVLTGLCNCQTATKNRIEVEDPIQSDSALHAKNIKSTENIKSDSNFYVDDFDNANLSSTQAVEIERIKEKYSITEYLDTTVNIQGKELRLVLKYYCLRDSILIIPADYMLETGTAFTTHPFATDVILMNDIDTMLNVSLKASDFNPYFDDQFGGNLKKYGSILGLPDLSANRLERGELLILFPLAIPATDLGKGMWLALDNEGNYNIYDPYQLAVE